MGIKKRPEGRLGIFALVFSCPGTDALDDGVDVVDHEVWAFSRELDETQEERLFVLLRHAFIDRGNKLGELDGEQ